MFCCFSENNDGASAAMFPHGSVWSCSLFSQSSWEPFFLRIFFWGFRPEPLPRGPCLGFPCPSTRVRPSRGVDDEEEEEDEVEGGEELVLKEEDYAQWCHWSVREVGGGTRCSDRPLHEAVPPPNPIPAVSIEWNGPPPKLFQLLLTSGSTSFS